MQISREAALRFNSMAKRHRKLYPYTIDALALENEIKIEFVKTFIEDKKLIERKFIDRMLNKAVKQTQKTHKTITHYLPCVITIKGEPDKFQIGPVRFITTEQFFINFGAKIKTDYSSATQQIQRTEERKKVKGKQRPLKGLSSEELIRPDAAFITRLYDYYKSYIWVAEVTVPICDKKISRERAVHAVQGALDILKLFFGHKDGHDLRLGHDTARPDNTADITRTEDGIFHHEIGWHGFGVYANSNWYNNIISNNGWHLAGAGNAIEGYLKPENKSDHRDRWLRALNWYGKAVSDNLPAFQLIKYVAALECLTVTPSDKICGVTDIVTRRTALLIAQAYGNDVFEKTYTNARELYRGRSDLMHGRVSPTNKEINNILPLAHEIGQKVLFVALELFGYLEMNGRNSSSDLFDEYRELERQRSMEEKSCDSGNT